jgi:choline-glycine betaine transporter
VCVCVCVCVRACVCVCVGVGVGVTVLCECVFQNSVCVPSVWSVVDTSMFLLTVFRDSICMYLYLQTLPKLDRIKRTWCI